MSIHGIWGHPFLDVTPFLDVRELEGLDAEITAGLAQVEVAMTGGSHRSMGIMPPARAGEALGDYGEAIAAMTPAERAAFLALGEAAPPVAAADGGFGEDAEHPLSIAQMRYLKYRAGVYFPWQVYYELLPNRWWSEKSRGHGKAFTAEAERLFPRTVAFVRGLPFAELGWVKLLGLMPNDHGTVHRDGDPRTKLAVDNFITLCPRGDKRLYLWDEAQDVTLPAPGRAYWFNDADYHGIEADPCFRYSIRVDGVFTDDFVERLLDRYAPI